VFQGLETLKGAEPAPPEMGRGRPKTEDRMQDSRDGEPEVTLEDIQRAAAVIKGHIITTPCDPSRTLSAKHGCEIWLKFENLQFTSSYKERGALNRLSVLTPEERRRGVIAMSAGNHAQGVAYHAGRLGIPATIVMPEGTPEVKSENTKKHGAEVI